MYTLHLSNISNLSCCKNFKWSDWFNNAFSEKPSQFIFANQIVFCSLGDQDQLNFMSILVPSNAADTSLQLYDSIKDYKI